MGKDYSNYSYWLETCGDDLTPRPALEGTIDADIAILGAGYTGLWTAYYLLRADPSLKVVLLEKEIAGFGASGRNGGWCSSGFPMTVGRLAQLYGRNAAIQVQQMMYGAVDEVGRVAQEEDLDIDFQKGGSLRLARGPHQLPAIQESYESYKELGLEDHYELLDEQETAQRIRVTKAVGSLYSPETAVIHPGKLVRGLARTIERMGGTIFEQTAVTDFTTGAYPALHSKQGNVRARIIALCGEAYLSQLRKVGRQVMPMYSLITLTEPLSQSDWELIGWEQRECVASSRYTVDYLSKTPDGRILFGGRGAPYHFRSRMDDAYDQHPATHRMLQDYVREWFPMLKDVKFTHTWGGPVGWPRDFMPTMSFNLRENLATARGYTGMGVATANLSGRVLTDLMMGRQSQLTTLPMVGHRSPNWEPEPFRYIGVRYVQQQFMSIDRRAEQTGESPSGNTLAERLTRH